MEKRRIIISRTDSIGDVILTLPMAGVIKEIDPNTEIIFLGQDYTKAIVSLSVYVDDFADWNALKKTNPDNPLQVLEADSILHVYPRKEIALAAKKAGIRHRIGTTNRLYHWFSCNKMLRFSRKRSDLHEAELNLKLLQGLGISKRPPLVGLSDHYGFENLPSLDEALFCLLSQDKFNLILHPKSKGSAREWGLKNFAGLIEILPQDQYEIFLTGTEKEGKLFRAELAAPFPHVTDLSGQMSLSDLIAFIAHSDGLVAASTGPLHMAAALGKKAIGIYPPIKPMHPGRWAPLGKNAQYIVKKKECKDCRKEQTCKCMKEITPEEVLDRLPVKGIA